MSAQDREGDLHAGGLSPAGPFAPLPVDIARTLSFLAHFIDETIALRGVGIGVREFAAAFLRVPLTRVVIASRETSPMEFQLAALALAGDLAAHPPAAVIGEDQEEPPRRETLDLGDEPTWWSPTASGRRSTATSTVSSPVSPGSGRRASPATEAPQPPGLYL